MQSNYSAFKIFSLIHLTMTSPKNKQPSNFTHLISVISQISEQILFAYYSIIITVQINKLITLKFRFCIQNDRHVTPLNPFLFSVSFDQFYFLFLANSEKTSHDWFIKCKSICKFQCQCVVDKIHWQYAQDEWQID